MEQELIGSETKIMSKVGRHFYWGMLLQWDNNFVYKSVKDWSC